MCEEAGRLMGVWFYSPGQGHLRLSKCEDLDELDIAHLPSRSLSQTRGHD